MEHVVKVGSGSTMQAGYASETFACVQPGVNYLRACDPVSSICVRATRCHPFACVQPGVIDTYDL
eukprot:365861-Chlamydomonas_euryale.AAC.32